jgi:hypothetical protein
MRVTISPLVLSPNAFAIAADRGHHGDRLLTCASVCCAILLRDSFSMSGDGFHIGKRASHRRLGDVDSVP